MLHAHSINISLIVDDDDKDIRQENLIFTVESYNENAIKKIITILYKEFNDIINSYGYHSLLRVMNNMCAKEFHGIGYGDKLAELCDNYEIDFKWQHTNPSTQTKH